MIVSKEIYEKLKSYQAWINAGAPENDPYTGEYGLCSNLSLYGKLHPYLLHEKLDPITPFNEDDSAYAEEKEASRCHLNPARLAWVAEKIADYERNMKGVPINE